MHHDRPANKREHQLVPSTTRPAERSTTKAITTYCGLSKEAVGAVEAEKDKAGNPTEEVVGGGEVEEVPVVVGVVEEEDGANELG